MSEAKPGFRQPKQKTVKQQVAELHAAVANIQQALSIQKIVFEQFASGFGKLDKDMHNAMGVLNDLQYRTLALVEASSNTAAIDKIAEDFKLKDYNDASDKEDLSKGYVLDDIVKEDSIVTLSSKCEKNPEYAIFRTKFKLNDEVVLPELKGKILGLKAGDTVETKLPDGMTHLLEVICVKKLIPSLSPVKDTAASEKTDSKQ